MTTATASTQATTVDVEIPNFRALYEGAVRWDACGPVAGEDAIAALENRAPDIGLALKAVARDMAARRPDGKPRFVQGSGQTLDDIAWDLEQQGFKQLTVVPYSNTPNLAAIHALVKEGGLNKWPVILQVSRAYALPDNEVGVRYHFVVSGGINSVKGYLIANGDTRTGITTAKYHTWPGAFQLPLNWATWAQLQAAGICGAILVHPKDWTPAPPPPPAPQPATVTIEAATIIALQQQAQAATQALTALTSSVNALPTK